MGSGHRTNHRSLTDLPVRCLAAPQNCCTPDNLTTPLFELVGVSLRDPDRYAWFTASVIADWLSPIQEVLVAAGMDVEQARVFGTVVLSLLRGLHMDYAMTGDRERIGAAYRLVVDEIGPTL